MTNKDLIPVSLVGIFRTNVRFFSLLLSLIKKSRDLSWTCPVCYFRAGRHALPGGNAARGPRTRKPLSPALESQGYRFPS